MGKKNRYLSIINSILYCLCFACGTSLTIAAPQNNGSDSAILLDVASVYNGAFVVVEDADYGAIARASQALSGMRNYGDYMIKAEGAQSDFLIELAESAIIERLRFIGPLNDNYAPKRIEVALSDSPSGPFEVIANAEFTLIDNKDPYNNAFDLSIPVTKKHSGRFMRFRMLGSLAGDSSLNYHSMASFQAFGSFDKTPAVPEIAGVYRIQGDFGNDSSGGFYLSLQQDGG